MCGICGVYHFNQQPVDISMLKKMNKAMVHRGPDDEGFYTEKNVGLAMRRLSIIDTEGGHQPISNEDDSIWVVMNGEIYNYIELRKELEAKGHRFRTHTDTEVIVHLYEEEGRLAVQKLNGMFAFALYDAKKQSLWIVRDRLGIKPLYYQLSKEGLFFASELSSLTKAMPEKTLSEESLLLYLGFHYIPGEYTPYQEVKKLLPAHELWCDAKGVHSSCYWSLNNVSIVNQTQQEAEEKLNELLADAVRLQMRSDVPVGTFLSGGVDSSAVTALAAEQTQQPLSTFTIDFLGKGSQDAAFARLVADRYQTQHYEIPFSAAEACQVLDDLIPFLDEPIADSAIIPTYWIAKHAQEKGVKVLLTGAGGDELFGGYLRHRRPKLGSTTWFAEQTPQFLRPLLVRLMALLNPDKSIRMQDPRIAFGAGYAGVNLQGLQGLFKESQPFSALLNHYLYELEGLNDDPQHYAYSRMRVDTQHYLVDDILALNDKMTMACSVEGRVPLLDHRLVEFAFSMPEKLNLLNGEGKGLFKQALRNKLPDKLLYRPKEGFNAPIFSWGDGCLGKKMTEELMDSVNPLFERLFDREHLYLMLKSAERGHRVAITVFGLFLFNKWYYG